MLRFKTLLPLALVLTSIVSGDRRTGRQNGGRNGGQAVSVPGGVDFSNCETQPDGTCCVIKESKVTSLQKDPVLECKHKNVEKCHYTYVTQFNPTQEEVCEENFEKKCQITFRQVAQKDTVQKCITPLRKVCDENNNQPQYGGSSGFSRATSSGYGAPQQQSAPEECMTYYESSCTTRYVEKAPGKFVGDTQCQKQPIRMCGQGCRMEQAPQQCHEKDIDVLVDVPEEVCDLNPQKTCRLQTKLVPSLKPEHECTIVPQEVCNLKFTPPKNVEKPLKTRWCIDPYAEVERGETYEESQAAAAPIASYGASASAPQSYAQPAPPPRSYSQPAAPAPQSYSQPAAPAPQSYSQPAAPAPQSYSQPSPPPQSYSQPAAPAPQSYSQPAAPAPQSYSQPEPAPQTYSQPSQQSYNSPTPSAPPPSYSQAAPLTPEPPVYYKPAPQSSPTATYTKPAPAQPSYGAPQPQQSQYGAPRQDPPQFRPPQPQYGHFRAKRRNDI